MTEHLHEAFGQDKNYRPEGKDGVDEILSVWESLSERRKAGVFALILWLIYGLIIRVWED